MMNLIYRGNSYQRAEIATSTQLSSKTAKYRGCTYSIPTSTERQSTAHLQLIYRGCPIA
jgi:hypothetical protein